MKQSFLILAHKSPNQLTLLVDYLLQNNCRVFLHIDKKSEPEFTEFLRRHQGREGLHCFSIYKVYWGSFNQIEATFFLLRESLKYPFDFVSLISGQDLPIKSISAFNEFLAVHRDSSFMAYHRLPDPSNFEGEGGLERVKYHWFTDFGRVSGFLFDKLNVVLHAFQRMTGVVKKWNGDLYAGPNWFTINREAAEYAMNYVQTHSAFYNNFRNTRLADEIILQTILLTNKELRVVNNCLRFIDWKTGPQYPRILTTGDKERLASADEFIARKFDEKVDAAVISYIYKRI